MLCIIPSFAIFAESTEALLDDDAGIPVLKGCRKWIPWRLFTLVPNGMLQARATMAIL